MNASQNLLGTDYVRKNNLVNFQIIGYVDSVIIFQAM